MRILIAVSETATRQQLEDFFLARGHEVTAHSEIRPARRALAGGAYSIVLVDLEPDAAGALELCREVRSLPRGRRAFVLALTRMESLAALLPALEAGADDYLAKPIRLAALELRLVIGQRQRPARRGAGQIPVESRVGGEAKRESRLAHAIEAEQQVLYYQPIVALTSGRIVACEALVRWRHPERGLLGPAELIPACEASGLILPLGRWILEQAFSQAVAWQRRFAGREGLGLSVNLSEEQLTAPDFFADLDRLAAKTGVRPEAIAFELREGLLVDAPESIPLLWQLRKRGFRLHLDRFGTGATSLQELYRSPVEALKIDRSFTSRVKAGGEDADIVRAASALGVGLGLSVVAEGIETANQLESARRLGPTHAQGYLFSRPLPEEEATALIAEDPKW